MKGAFTRFLTKPNVWAIKIAVKPCTTSGKCYLPVILITKPDVLAVTNNRIGNFFVCDNRVL